MGLVGGDMIENGNENRRSVAHFEQDEGCFRGGGGYCMVNRKSAYNKFACLLPPSHSDTLGKLDEKMRNQDYDRGGYMV